MGTLFLIIGTCRAYSFASNIHYADLFPDILNVSLFILIFTKDIKLPVSEIYRWWRNMTQTKTEKYYTNQDGEI